MTKKGRKAPVCKPLSSLTRSKPLSSIHYNKSSYVINFVGGPGCGKTALCCMVFAEMKMLNKSVEYVPEIAKQLVWTKQFDLLNNQHYVTTRQYEYVAAVNNQVDYILTDGPLLHGLYYNRHNHNNYCAIDKVESLIIRKMQDFKNIYIFVRKGDFPYEQSGRLETEEESYKISKCIEDILQKLNLPYLEVRSGKDCNFQEIIEYIDNCIQSSTKENKTDIKGEIVMEQLDKKLLEHEIIQCC